MYGSNYIGNIWRFLRNNINQIHAALPRYVTPSYDQLMLATVATLSTEYNQVHFESMGFYMPMCHEPPITSQIHPVLAGLHQEEEEVEENEVEETKERKEGTDKENQENINE